MTYLLESDVQLKSERARCSRLEEQLRAIVTQAQYSCLVDHHHSYAGGLGENTEEKESEEGEWVTNATVTTSSILKSSSAARRDVDPLRDMSMMSPLTDFKPSSTVISATKAVRSADNRQKQNAACEHAPERLQPGLSGQVVPTLRDEADLTYISRYHARQVSSPSAQSHSLAAIDGTLAHGNNEDSSDVKSGVISGVISGVGGDEARMVMVADCWPPFTSPVGRKPQTVSHSSATANLDSCGLSPVPVSGTPIVVTPDGSAPFGHRRKYSAAAGAPANSGHTAATSSTADTGSSTVTKMDIMRSPQQSFTSGSCVTSMSETRSYEHGNQIYSHSLPVDGRIVAGAIAESSRQTQVAWQALFGSEDGSEEGEVEDAVVKAMNNPREDEVTRRAPTTVYSRSASKGGAAGPLDTGPLPVPPVQSETPQRRPHSRPPQVRKCIFTRSPFDASVVYLLFAAMK